ncbi:7036_t:CDS:2, partial [Acaulospora colombiana]
DKWKSIRTVAKISKALYRRLAHNTGEASNQQLDQIERFSSVAFVGRAHEYRRLEAEHTYIKPVAYIDIETGEARSTIVFGTEIEKEVMKKAADAILDRRGLSYTVSLVPSIQHIYELERQFRPDVSLDDTLKTFTDEELDGEAMRFGTRKYESSMNGNAYG